MRIREILREEGGFQMKLSSSESSDYMNDGGDSSGSPKETRKRHKDIAKRYNVNIVDDYDEYLNSGKKETDKEKSPLTKVPKK